MVVTYRGWLTEADWGDGLDILWLSPVQGALKVDASGFHVLPDDWPDKPLARLISDDMADRGRYLSVRYFLSDHKEAPGAIDEAVANLSSGLGHAEVGHYYSEVTGYLWTSEEIMVGGHDLIEELHTYRGKWCHLEISYSHEPVA